MVRWVAPLVSSFVSYTPTAKGIWFITSLLSGDCCWTRSVCASEINFVIYLRAAAQQDSKGGGKANGQVSSNSEDQYSLDLKEFAVNLDYPLMTKTKWKIVTGVAHHSFNWCLGGYYRTIPIQPIPFRLFRNFYRYPLFPSISCTWVAVEWCNFSITNSFPFSVDLIILSTPIGHHTVPVQGITCDLFPEELWLEIY